MLPGRVLQDAFEVEDQIGMGAMGAVFRGRQIRLRRTVAIKVPKPEYAADPEFLARFEREALTMAKLVHENVVQIFDVFVSKSTAEPSFIVMELVEGSELEKFLRQQEQSLTVAAVCDLFEQVARGIDAANSRGIIHRDIKPSNIVVTMPQRVAKIMDFGIARIEMENVFATQDSSTMGTPAYMAPEQVAGQRLTPAADIYSFAMTMYKLLARSLPFESTTNNGILFAQVHTEPMPIHARNPELPFALSNALMDGLAKLPQNRPASAIELARNVTKALEPMAARPFAELFRNEPSKQQVLKVSGDQGVTQATQTEWSPEQRAVAEIKLEVRQALENQAEEIDLALRTPIPVAPKDPPFPFNLPPRQRLIFFSGAVTTFFLIVLIAAVATRPPREVEPPPVAAVTPTEPDPVAAAPGDQPNSGAEEPEPVILAAVPNPTPTPRPTPVRTPEPTPRPSPTALPSPTPLQPTPTPEPAQGGPRVLADDYDPLRFPPLIDRAEIRRVRLQLDRFISERIEQPIYRRNWRADSNALVENGSELADLLPRLLERLEVTHYDLAVGFVVQDNTIFWLDRALVTLRMGVEGRPKGGADPTSRPVLYQLPQPLVARIRRTGSVWQLETITGDFQPLRQFLEEKRP